MFSRDFVDGTMYGDCALSPEAKRLVPFPGRGCAGRRLVLTMLVPSAFTYPYGGGFLFVLIHRGWPY